MEVDHIDGNIRNNNIYNLRLVSRDENQLKAKICNENVLNKGVRFLRYKCPVCGKVFDREADYRLPEERIPKMIFCSPKCNGVYYSTHSKETADNNLDSFIYSYIRYNYLKSCLIAGPELFVNMVSCVRSYMPNFVFPIISEIDELVNDVAWHDVLYYTYSNQIKLGINKNESPEVITKITKFIRDYELAKTQNYIFDIMNNKYVYFPIMLPNMYKFQTDKGVTPFDISKNTKYVDLKKNEIIPEIHRFKI